MQNNDIEFLSKKRLKFLLYMQLQPSVLTTEEMMKERLVYLTELVKSRMEMDNISAVAMKAVQEG